eukprot:20198-Amphidinium_carterae.2
MFMSLCQLLVPQAHRSLTAMPQRLHGCALHSIDGETFEQRGKGSGSVVCSIERQPIQVLSLK